MVKEPGKAENWIKLGNFQFDNQNPAAAVTAYENALRLQPGNANVLTDLGIMYRELHRFDDALKAFREAERVQPGTGTPCSTRASSLYYDLKRKDEAEAAWRRLLAADPNAHAPDGTPVSELISTCTDPAPAALSPGPGSPPAPVAPWRADRRSGLPVPAAVPAFPGAASSRDGGAPQGKKSMTHPLLPTQAASRRLAPDRHPLLLVLSLAATCPAVPTPPPASAPTPALPADLSATPRGSAAGQLDILPYLSAFSGYGR